MQKVKHNVNLATNTKKLINLFNYYIIKNMRVNKNIIYSLSCLVDIAKANEKPVTLRQLSQRWNLSRDYLEQLLLKLKRKRIIRSMRGIRGGYLLNKKPHSISLKDIIEAQDEKILDILCFKGKVIGCNFKECDIKWVWIEFKKKLEKLLKDFKLSSLLNKIN